MNVEDLLPRLPDGVGLEIVERKIIEHGSIRIVTSIDLAVGGHPSMRFSTVADVSAALDLVTALAQPATRTVTTAPTLPRPRAIVIETQPEAPPTDAQATDEAIDDDTREWLDESADEAEIEAPAPEEPAMLLTTSFPPPAPVQPSFGGRPGPGARHSRKAGDKQPIVPTTSLIGRI